MLHRPNGAWDIPRDAITRCSIGAWPGVLFAARLPPGTVYRLLNPCQTVLQAVRASTLPEVKVISDHYVTAESGVYAGSPYVLLTYRALLFCYCLGLGVSQTVTRGVWTFAYYTMW